MGDCCQGSGKCLVYACAGGSNVGQLSVEAAKALDSAGEGTMSCLAGLGGHVAGMVTSAQSGLPLLFIDGCPVACARKTAEHLGLKDFSYVEITSLGIGKEHNVSKTPNHQIEEVLKAARTELAKIPVTACPPGGSCCG